MVVIFYDKLDLNSRTSVHRYMLATFVMNSFRSTHALALSDSTTVVRVQGTFVVFHDVNFKISVGKQIL